MCPESKRKDLRTAAGIGLLVFVAFNANLRVIGAGDTYPARYLPFGILRDGALTLDRLAPNVTQGRVGTAFWAVPGRGGHTISLYPVVLPVLVTPLYVPAAAYLRVRGFTVQRLERVARIMEKATASLIASAATAAMYLLLRRRSSRALSALLALVFALGTTTWVISSQGLWQHGMGELLAALALLVVTGAPSHGRAAALGVLCGLLASNRPPDAILAAALVLAGLSWAARSARWIVIGAAVPAALTLLYNLVAAGNPAGAYGAVGDASFLAHDFLGGLAGLLVSPTRGLLVFSPFLLAVPLAFRPLLRDASSRRLTLLVAAALVLNVSLYAKADWRMGMAWGPRWLTDLLPFLFWLLPSAIARLSRGGRALFGAGCIAAVAIEAIGAFWYAGTSDAAIFAGDGTKEAWSFANAPFVSELTHRRAPGDLFVGVQGSVDGILQSGLPVATVSPDAPAAAAGWTLTGRTTPFSVAVFVDGRPVAETRTFGARPDVAAATGTASPAGWLLPLPTGLAPREHVVAIQARAAEYGESRFVAERRFLYAESPGPAAHGGDPTSRAAALVRVHQDPEGYWLTSFTDAPRFERPSREMNTFLTSVLVDLLGPADRETGLEPDLARARRHLAAQIEPDGLVRYHGLPDAGTIGVLGCAITPDADDTALVWRIAPGPRGLLREALATLRSWRRSDGLYRTWLAPRERYECIDPGRDPNPADATIQMHVLLLLAKEDPPAARSLCAALRRKIGNDDVWVYYEKTPLLPILRQGALARGGCRVSVPARRLHAVEGQEIWVKACSLLARFLAGGGPPPAREETRAVLGTISADDFALARRSPPLLYHNDLSASVSRFYWSEDFGLAVWLRLHFENERRP